MMVQEFVNIDKDLQTAQDVSDVNIIILIYLFIKHVLFILMYLYKCKMYVSRVETIWERLSFHMITWLPVFNIPQLVAKLVIPPNYRLHRRWRFNQGALYTLSCTHKEILVYLLFARYSIAILHKGSGSNWLLNTSITGSHMSGSKQILKLRSIIIMFWSRRFSILYLE